MPVLHEVAFDDHECIGEADIDRAFNLGEPVYRSLGSTLDRVHGMGGDDGVVDDSGGLVDVIMGSGMWGDLDAEHDDPLAMLYLEPGTIASPSKGPTPGSLRRTPHSTGDLLSNSAVRSVGSGALLRGLGGSPGAPSMTRTRTLDMEESAVSQLRELSVLCGEDPDAILADAGAAGEPPATAPAATDAAAAAAAAVATA